MIDFTTTFGTDTATVAIFDPAVLSHRVADDGDWWCGDFASLPEVIRGDSAFVSLGGDGVYAIRLTDGPLTPDETAYASEMISLGVEVRSGLLFVGPGEYLPGDDLTVDPADPELTDRFVSVHPGRYQLDLYAISWRDAPQWYSEDEVVPDVPPDLAVVLRPQVSPFLALTREPRLFVSFGTWVFPDRERRLGPEPGMLLRTTVVRRRDELVLKPCGPLNYRPVVESLEGHKQKDLVLVEVISVDHNSREFRGVVQGAAA